jgi:hypothetical protein
MKRLLLTALVVVGLLTVALPVTVMAAGGGNSAAADDHRDSWDDLGFKNRGACVSFFARGGTIDPFRALCAQNGGVWSPSGLSLAPAWEFDHEIDTVSMSGPFSPICRSLGTGTVVISAAGAGRVGCS